MQEQGISRKRRRNQKGDCITLLKPLCQLVPLAVCSYMHQYMHLQSIFSCLSALCLYEFCSSIHSLSACLFVHLISTLSSLSFSILSFSRFLCSLIFPKSLIPMIGAVHSRSNARLTASIPLFTFPEKWSEREGTFWNPTVMWSIEETLGEAKPRVEH